MSLRSEGIKTPLVSCYTELRLMWSVIFWISLLSGTWTPLGKYKKGTMKQRDREKHKVLKFHMVMAY